MVASGSSPPDHSHREAAFPYQEEPHGVGFGFPYFSPAGRWRETGKEDDGVCPRKQGKIAAVFRELAGEEGGSSVATRVEYGGSCEAG